MKLIAKTILLVLILNLGFGLTISKSQNCEYLNDIAVKSISKRFTNNDLNKIKACNDKGLHDTIAIKTEFVHYITNHPDFIEQIVLLMRFRILKGTTFTDVYRQIESFDVLQLVLPLAMDDEEEKTMYRNEANRLYQVYQLTDNLKNDSISLEEMYQVLFDNFFYDNQNMGEDNFITSTFQYSMGRNPTDLEIMASKKMLKEEESILFYQKGDSKEDYLNIITSNNNFYEYQVKYWYYYFMLENPDNAIIYDILNNIKVQNTSINIDAIIKYILIHIV